jgi:hypothetical protein
MRSASKAAFKIRVEEQRCGADRRRPKSPAEHRAIPTITVASPGGGAAGQTVRRPVAELSADGSFGLSTEKQKEEGPLDKFLANVADIFDICSAWAFVKEGDCRVV